MPKLIKEGDIVEDNWLPARSRGSAIRSDRQILTLEQWLALEDKTEPARCNWSPVRDLTPLFGHLDDIALVPINFPVFTDGRGFSYARELRERGYAASCVPRVILFATNWHYLQRCGFNAFQLAQDESSWRACRGQPARISANTTRPAADQPLPLFRRRSG